MRNNVEVENKIMQQKISGESRFLKVHDIFNRQKGGIHVDSHNKKNIQHEYIIA